MADDVDVANERVQRDLDARINAARQACAADDYSETCKQCGKPISQERLAAIKTATCFDCASDAEHHDRIHKKPW